MKLLCPLSGLRFLLLAFATTFSVAAANHTVVNLSSTGPGSLRQAIADCGNGDTVDFAPNVTGTIVLTNGELSINKSIFINGPGPSKLTVSGNSSGRVFYMSQGSVTVAGLTITDGNHVYGGGVFTHALSVTMSNCVITRNRANNAGSGGILAYGEFTLINSVVCSNFPGGMSNRWSATIINSSIFNNTNFAPGGGIAIGDFIAPPWLFVSNSTISGNVSLGGGGIYAQCTNIVIVSSTICSNSAGASLASGGGILALSNTTLLNCIVAGNTGTTRPDCRGVFNSLGYNLILNTNGATFTNITANNIYNQDPKLGPLADLGGSTWTHALRPGSPALDAGYSGGLSTDQRGSARAIDDLSIANPSGGDGSDIGAYEADPQVRIARMESVGTNLQLRLNTLVDRTYQLESQEALGGTWNALTNSDFLGSGSSVQAIDISAPGVPQQFYRAVLLP